VAITSIKTGSSFKTLTKYDSFLAGNPAFSPSSFESIATVTATGGETSLNFTSIPSTYKHLQIRGIAKVNFVSATPASDYGYIRFNNDSSSNYAFHQIFGNGAGSVSSTGSASQGAGGGCITQIYGTASNIFAVSIVDILDYASTTKYKTARSFSGGELNSGTTTSTITLNSVLWQSISAITSIQILPVINTFFAGSTFALYGIKG
jgi:hypothetical protein